MRLEIFAESEQLGETKAVGYLFHLQGQSANTWFELMQGGDTTRMMQVAMRKWNVKNLSSMYGNWGFLLLVYVLPLCLTGVRFMTLAAFIFLFAEVLMHCVLFPIRLRTPYNAGLVTSLGAGAIACCYFFGGVFDGSLFLWHDWVIAVLWFAAVFVLSFRYKLYWSLSKLPGYPLTEQSAFGPFKIEK